MRGRSSARGRRRRRRGGRVASPRRCGRSAGDEDLGAEAPRLLERADRERFSGHTGGEAEVVLDLRRRAGLAAGCLALDHDRLEALGGAVHGRGQPGGAGADDHGVVLRCLGLGLDLEQLRDTAELGPHHCLAVDDPERGVVTLGRQIGPPLLGFPPARRAAATCG